MHYLTAPFVLQVKVVFPRNVRTGGSLPPAKLKLQEWVQAKGGNFRPISHPQFQSYDGPLPLDIEKQRDLRTISKYLRPYLSQGDIDALYPEPDTDLYAHSDSGSDESNSGGSESD